MLVNHTEILSTLSRLEEEIKNIKQEIIDKFDNEMDQMEKEMDRKNLSDL